MTNPTLPQDANTGPEPPTKARASGSTYPLRRPRHSDQRFTVGLVFDIAAVLARHGYPDLACGNDILHWQNALFTTIYRHDSKGTLL
jgi:hypothetical protein